MRVDFKQLLIVVATLIIVLTICIAPWKCADKNLRVLPDGGLYTQDSGVIDAGATTDAPAP